MPAFIFFNTTRRRGDTISQKKATCRLLFDHLVLFAVILVLTGCATEKKTTAPAARKTAAAAKIGYLANQQIVEASGIASSRLNPSLLWVINDGGNDPWLFAVGIDGSDLGTFQVEDAKNNDWEDLASFKLHDTAYLLIADVGDNREQRRTCCLYVVKEPANTHTAIGRDATVDIAWCIHFIYEEGPRDCEAVAVDADRRRVLLMSKRGLVPTLYELPLQQTENAKVAVARRLTTVPYFTWPTAMDLSPDDLSAVVLTYDSAYLFRRRQNQDWTKAFEKRPQQLQFSNLNQQEAACFGFFAKFVYVTSEKIPAPLLRIDLE